MFLDISYQWLNEIIFCLRNTSSTKKHILTRKMLLETARDKDGGAHVDKKLNDVPEYVLSKIGVELGDFGNGKKSTTKNYHFLMLRQLAYEILNSPDIPHFLEE